MTGRVVQGHSHGHDGAIDQDGRRGDSEGRGGAGALGEVSRAVSR